MIDLSKSPEKLAKLLGVTKGTVITMSKRPGYEIWAEDKAWLKANNLGKNSKVFRRGEERCALPLIRELTGLVTGHLSIRIQDWADGKIDCDDLFSPFTRSADTEPSDRRWGNMTGSDRSHLLKSIPEPTKFDRKYQ